MSQRSSPASNGCKNCDEPVVWVPDRGGRWTHYRADSSCGRPEPGGEYANNIAEELDRLEREDPAMQAASVRLDAVGEYLKGRLPSSTVQAIYDLSKSVHDTSKLRQSDFTLSPPESGDPPVQRWETTLDLDEAGGH